MINLNSEVEKSKNVKIDGLWYMYLQQDASDIIE